MPDAKDENGFCVECVTDNITPDDQIPERIGIGCLCNTNAHFRKLFETGDALDQILGDAGGSLRIVFGDEVPQAYQVCKSLRRVQQVHSGTLGAGNSLLLPHDSSHS